MEEKNVISNHIFIFPFKWDYLKNNKSINNCIDVRVNIDKFTNLLSEYWEEESLSISEDKDYNKYTYFYSNVRKAIYGERKCNNKINKKNNEVVRCFSNKLVSGNSRYIIKIRENGRNDNYIVKEYPLSLVGIRLKVYDTGVANLIFFVENKEFSEENDILKINEFGRRIYPQFLSVDKCKNAFLAEELCIEFCCGKTIEDLFNNNYLNEPITISKIIMDVLGDNFISDSCKIIKNKILITPLIDDRMFVMSFLRDSNKSFQIKYKEYYQKEYESFWYRYIFIDTNEPTCQDKEMNKILIKDSTYGRWSQYGTLYGISRYSFVVLVKDDEFAEELVKHFSGMYYEMVLLALTDRASLLRFNDEASRIAKLNERKALEEVKSLQKKYVSFINNIYFREVTAQEQGIEIYDMLMKKMNIEEDLSKVSNLINNIYSYANQIISENTNNILNIMTIGSLVIAIGEFLIGEKNIELKLILILIFLALIIIYYCHKKKKQVKF